jgi:hypothetical protein
LNYSVADIGDKLERLMQEVDVVFEAREELK